MTLIQHEHVPVLYNDIDTTRTCTVLYNDIDTTGTYTVLHNDIATVQTCSGTI